MLCRIAQNLPSTGILDNGISVPKKPLDLAPTHRTQSGEVSTVVREGNRAIPIQWIYEDDTDDREGGA